MHKWRPIEDYKDSGDESAHNELRHLADVWQEQKSQLDQDALQKFNEKLKREWAIETGLIERAYVLDRGTTQLLIEKGISERLIPRRNGDSPGRIAAVLRDHENVINGLFDFIKGKRELSTSYIKEMHNALMQNQETTEAINPSGKVIQMSLVRGQYKQLPNNPLTIDGETHEYCPPEQTGSEMDNLIEMYKKQKIPPLAQAAWLHHRFTQIHPFQDGNGRVARSLATLVFIKEGWFPLVIRQELRESYLDVLEKADTGNLSPLIDLLAIVQKKYFVDALGIIREVARETSSVSTDKIYESQETTLIKAGVAKTRERLNTLMQNYEHAKTIAAKLQDEAYNRLEKTSISIKQESGNNTTTESWLDCAKNGDDKDGYFRNQIVDVAKDLGYYANINIYRAWVKMAIKTDNRTEILIFFHGTGNAYRGVIVCSACSIIRDKTEEETHISPPQILNDEVFQINYKEPEEQTQKRFQAWLDKVILVGLRIWKDSL